MCIKRVITAVAICTFFLGCGDTKVEFTDKTQIQTTNNNEITLTTLDGQLIEILKDGSSMHFKDENKVILLNFFATWCPPCKAEIPHFNSLQNNYKDDLKIISVTLEEIGLEELQKFFDYYQNNYDVTHGKESFDLAKMVGGVRSIPYTIIYDKKGHYFTHYTGAVPEEMMEADIKKAIER